MKSFSELRVFCLEPNGGTEDQRTGLWGKDYATDDWQRVCECPVAIAYYPVGPTHLESFTQGHIFPSFNSMTVAETVVNIVAVCRNNGAWAIGDGWNKHSFHLSDLQHRRGLQTLLDTGFVIKNEDETYIVTKGLVMLLVANELDPSSIVPAKVGESVAA